jgi:hypothetical protein
MLGGCPTGEWIMIILTLVLMESEVSRHANGQMIRFGDCFYAKVLQFNTILEVTAFLKQKLSENRVYVTVKVGEVYEIYQQTSLAKTFEMTGAKGDSDAAPANSGNAPDANNAPAANKVVTATAPEAEASETLYYRGRPYKKS